MSRFLRRMLRAALLDRAVYEEVEHDPGATREALAVVVLSAVAAGIGSIENSGPRGILWGTLAALVGWNVWAYTTYLIGTHLLPTRDTVADHGQLLRTIGFSSAPGVLRLLAVIPSIAGPAFLLGTLWMMVAMVVAVRQALDYTSTLRAIAVCAIGFPVYAVLLATSLLLLGAWPV
jgi:hypothetical protein